MLTVVLYAVLLAAQAGTGAWDSLHFLEGEWIGEGGGRPGESSGGGFSFRRELDGRILVRRNRAEYAATRERPASVHEDLMVIYPGGRRAVYFDSEGHVINYKIEADGKSAVFRSEDSAQEPRYRLTYHGTGTDTVSILFEIAPPGQPFQKYIEAKARRP